jgi:hypothetical protein
MMNYDATEQGKKRHGRWNNSTLVELLGDEGCARRGYLQYEQLEPVPPSFDGLVGTAVHSGIEHALEAFKAGEPWPSIDEMCDAAQVLIDSQRPHLTFYPWVGKLGRQATYDDVTVLVRQALTNWVHAKLSANKAPEGLAGQTLRDRYAGLDVIAIELPIEVEVPGISRPLAATIDVVAVDPKLGVTLLIDHKTSWDMSAYGLDKLLEGTKAWQPAHYFYGFARTALAKELPAHRLFEWHVIHKQELKPRTQNARITRWVPDATALQQVFARMQAGDEVVADGRFLPNPASPWCGERCPFLSRCQQGNQQLAKPLAYVDEYLELLRSERRAFRAA